MSGLGVTHQPFSGKLCVWVGVKIPCTIAQLGMIWDFGIVTPVLEPYILVTINSATHSCRCRVSFNPCQRCMVADHMQDISRSSMPRRQQSSSSSIISCCTHHPVPLLPNLICPAFILMPANLPNLNWKEQRIGQHSVYKSLLVSFVSTFIHSFFIFNFQPLNKSIWNCFALNSQFQPDRFTLTCLQPLRKVQLDA